MLVEVGEGLVEGEVGLDTDIFFILRFTQVVFLGLEEGPGI